MDLSSWAIAKQIQTMTKIVTMKYESSRITRRRYVNWSQHSTVTRTRTTIKLYLMFFDLNIPIKKSLARLNISKKSKQLETTTTWTAAEIADMERRVDVLVHCWYKYHLLLTYWTASSRIYRPCIFADSKQEDRSKNTCKLSRWLDFTASDTTRNCLSQTAQHHTRPG